MQANDWDANASFNSTRSMSEIFKPALCNALFVAGTGPIPMIEGSTPATAIETIFAVGFNPNFFTADSLASNMAAAPSLMPDEFPAVTVPFSMKADFSDANFSMDVLRGGSSLSIIDFSFFALIVSIATISSFHLHFSNAAKYFSWD